MMMIISDMESSFIEVLDFLKWIVTRRVSYGIVGIIEKLNECWSNNVLSKWEAYLIKNVFVNWYRMKRITNKCIP